MLKILIIDDDSIVLLVQRKLLQRCDFNNPIFSFNKGVKALEYLKEENASQSFLILLDINMPGMNGWQFLNEIKNLKGSDNIFVIMVTSSIDDFDKDVAENFNNVVGFMEKPITGKDCNGIKAIPEIKHFFRKD